jgi:hypothetical protein
MRVDAVAGNGSVWQISLAKTLVAVQIKRRGFTMRVDDVAGSIRLTLATGSSSCRTSTCTPRAGGYSSYGQP